MKNYIVRNCPAYLKYNKCLHNGHCDNITDCLMKRIVAECKWETNIDIECRGDLAERILSELEIEEMDE